MSGIVRSAGAELFRLRKWSAVWVIVAVWSALTLTFGYVFDYVAYATGSDSFASSGVPREALLAGLLPQGLADGFVQGMPMFGGALAMVLGALVAGNGFAWGTWKTVFTQGPSRLAATAGSLAALAVLVVGVVVLSVTVSAAASVGIALAEDQAVTWPTAAELAESVGAGVAVLGMWAVLGHALGLVTRSPALGVGLGLVWSLVVENLLRAVGAMLSGIETATQLLPGTAAGSLVGAVTDAASAPGGPTAPGVLTSLSDDRALVTVLVYVVAAVVLSLAVGARRDVA